MDFESIISFVLLFLFFIFPSVLKKMGRKKKSASPSVSQVKKKNSLLGKLGEQIQAFMRELEEQAKKAKQEQEGSGWDQLDDGTDIQEPLSSSDLDFEAEPHMAADTGADPEYIAPELDVSRGENQPKNRKRSREERSMQPLCLETVQGNLPSHALQQAVVWSEVLGKPVALRRD